MIRMHHACQVCGKALDFQVLKYYDHRDGRTLCMECTERRVAAERNERNLIVLFALGGAFLLCAAIAIFGSAVTQ